VNVGEDTTLGDGDVSEKLVQLLVVSDGELKMTGDDTGLLVVAGGVASQLEDFSSKVLEDSGEVDGSTGTDTLSVVALAEQTVDTTDGERQTGLGGATEETRVSRAGRKRRVETRVATHDWAFLEPEALPPDLPPPVILKDLDWVVWEKRG
jgi:hypothetical protein